MDMPLRDYTMRTRVLSVVFALASTAITAVQCQGAVPADPIEGVWTGTVNQNLPGTLIEHSAGLVKLDRDTGAVLWRLVLPRAAEGQFAGHAGSLALAGDKVIAAGLDGFLSAYPAE